jgi:hypothetical protein
LRDRNSWFVSRRLKRRKAAGTLTIKPLAALIIETHTSQSRIQSTIEKYVDQLARETYGSRSRCYPQAT